MDPSMDPLYRTLQWTPSMDPLYGPQGAGAGYLILGVGVGALGQQGLYRPRVASLTRQVQRRLFILHGTCSIHRRRSVVRAGGVAQGPCKREGG